MRCWLRMCCVATSSVFLFYTQHRSTSFLRSTNTTMECHICTHLLHKFQFGTPFYSHSKSLFSWDSIRIRIQYPYVFFVSFLFRTSPCGQETLMQLSSSVCQFKKHCCVVYHHSKFINNMRDKLEEKNGMVLCRIS